MTDHWVTTKHVFDEDELRNKISEAIAYAKSNRVDAVEASIAVENGFSVTARKGEVETLEHHQEKALHITVYINQQTAGASTSDLTADAIKATIDKACGIARYTNPDPFAGLADPELMAYHYPDLQLFHSWGITPPEAIDLAIECETVACEQDARIHHSEGASVSTYNHLSIYANSHGFMGSCPVSVHTISCVVVAEDQQQMQRDHEFTTARRHTDLDSAIFVAKQAAQKTLARLGARTLKTRQCPVIFYAPMAKGLLRNFIAAISGSQLYRQTSFLLNCLGQAIFPHSIHIYQQPHLLAGLGSSPFDSEGVITKNIDYVSDGVLTQYALGSYSARKLGLQTTGNAGGVYNLQIAESPFSLNELMRQMDTGLLVTELLGQGVNITTGDYSRGAVGFWVERGEIQFPVEGVTIAGNLREMFANLELVGNDLDLRGNIRSGSILIGNMTVAGN